MAKYKCPTLGDCDKANSGEVFERSPGEDLKCPGCGMLLDPQMTKTPSSNPVKMPLIAAGIGALALIALGGYFYKESTTVAAEPSESSMPSVASVPKYESVVSSAPTVAQDVGSGLANPPTTGISPSDAETKELRQQSDTHLVSGDASRAESASGKAASNELMKMAIAKMAQGKLDEAQTDLIQAQTRAPKQPLVYYNMAILRMKQGKMDEALKEFESSFKAGFSHFDKMDQDSDLDAFRKNPRFLELVATYRSSAK